MEVPASAEDPAIDPAKGYRVQELGRGLYMITDNAYQSMSMVYENGVVVIDAPPPFATHIPQAIAGVTGSRSLMPFTVTHTSPGLWRVSLRLEA